jgi:pilus assembly protein Flp/PilA
MFIYINVSVKPRAYFRHSLCEHAVMPRIIEFLKDERAATAIEYGIIAAGIAVAIIPVLTGVGGKLKATFTAIQTALK